MSTISNTVTVGVTLGAGTYTSPLTITATGTIDVGTGNGIYGPGDRYGGYRWTVHNSGYIHAGPGVGVGIELGYGTNRVGASFITNEVGGTITAVNGYGVRIYGSGTVVNSGSIHGKYKGIRISAAGAGAHGEPRPGQAAGQRRRPRSLAVLRKGAAAADRRARRSRGVARGGRPGRAAGCRVSTG